MNAPDPAKQEEIFKIVSERLFDWATQINGIYTPQWNIRNEVAKTLLTISSAAVVISMTLLSKLSAAQAYTPRVLTFCWIAFLASILTSVVTLWLSMGLYHLSSSVVDMRAELRKRIKAIDLSNAAAAVELIASITDKAMQGMGWRDRWATRTIKISLAAFITALATLAVIGWQRLF